MLNLEAKGDQKRKQTHDEEFDEILEAAGGFGRFQILASYVIVILFTTMNHLFFSLPLLVMLPKYRDVSGKEKSVSEYCNDVQNISVDKSYEWSLDNWIERYDIACVDPYKVALMCTMYFAGTTVFNLIVTRLGDVYGRKNPFRISCLISLPV